MGHATKVPSAVGILTMVVEIPHDYIASFMSDWGDTREKVAEHGYVKSAKLLLPSGEIELEV